MIAAHVNVPKHSIFLSRRTVTHLFGSMFNWGGKFHALENVDEVIREADIDGDGRVSYEEFVQKMNFPNRKGKGGASSGKWDRRQWAQKQKVCWAPKKLVTRSQKEEGLMFSVQENLVCNLVHSRTRTRPCQITSKYIQVHPTAIVHHPPRVQVVNIKFFWFWALCKERNGQDEGDDGILASRYCTILYWTVGVIFFARTQRFDRSIVLCSANKNNISRRVSRAWIHGLPQPSKLGMANQNTGGDMSLQSSCKAMRRIHTVQAQL